LEADRDRRELRLTVTTKHTKHTNMDGLYPIIRRVRRPLVPVEAAPANRPVDVKPVQAPKAGAGQESEQPKPQEKRGATASTERAE
jgi:hypothetical protein